MNKITVFVIPPFSLSLASGGAENICRMLCLSLAKHYEIMVLHSESDCSKPLGCLMQQSDSLFSCNAFYLDDWTKERGVISPVFCNIAQKMLQESELLISFERTIKGISVPQITVLGGISYEHCRDIASCKEWNKLIVPSFFIKNQCGRLRMGETEGIQVIHNGINCDCFFKYNENRTFTVLLPFRPDKGKGFFESIAFVSLVNKIGKWGQYSILITRMDDNSYQDFYEGINCYANEHNVEIRYTSWREPTAMNEIYNKADFVLSLGFLEEGFGLTTIESVLAGRAVITRNIGATSEVLPSGCGVVFIDSSLTYKAVSSVMDHVTSSIKMESELSVGATYIRNNYTEERMCEEMKMVVEEYLN